MSEGPAEVVIEIETTADVVGCSACGTRARHTSACRSRSGDLACFGRPARLVWTSGGRCPEADCEAKTWTERSEQVSRRALLTDGRYQG